MIPDSPNTLMKRESDIPAAPATTIAAICSMVAHGRCYGVCFIAFNCSRKNVATGIVIARAKPPAWPSNECPETR
jgi:hypothetical protein